MSLYAHGSPSPGILFSLPYGLACLPLLLDFGIISHINRTMKLDKMAPSNCHKLLVLSMLLKFVMVIDEPNFILHLILTSTCSNMILYCSMPLRF